MTFKHYFERFRKLLRIAVHGALFAFDIDQKNLSNSFYLQSAKTSSYDGKLKS